MLYSRFFFLRLYSVVLRSIQTMPMVHHIIYGTTSLMIPDNVFLISIHSLHYMTFVAISYEMNLHLMMDQIWIYRYTVLGLLSTARLCL